jgi:hypothetical protein
MLGYDYQQFTCWAIGGSCIVHGDAIQVLATMKIVAHGLKTNIKVILQPLRQKELKNEIERFLRR